MRARLLLVPTLLFAVAACAGSSGAGREPSPLMERERVLAGAPPAAPAAPAADPVGRWSLSLEAQGQMIELVMDIQQAGGGGYTGAASSNMFPTMALSRVVLTGNRLVVDAPTPMGTVATFDLLIEGDNMTGEWATSGMGSRVTGRRLR